LLPPDKSLQQSFQRLCLRVPRAILPSLRVDKTTRSPYFLFRVVFPSFTSDTPAFPYPVQMTIWDIWVLIIDLCFYSFQQTLRNKIVLRTGRKVLRLTCPKVIRSRYRLGSGEKDLTVWGRHHFMTLARACVPLNRTRIVGLDEAPRSSLLRRSSYFGYEGRKLRGIL
jgi:hypothetical protein